MSVERDGLALSVARDWCSAAAAPRRRGPRRWVVAVVAVRRKEGDVNEGHL